MKKKKYTVGQTFYVNEQMYHEMKERADVDSISHSELIRHALTQYLNAVKAKDERKEIS